MSPTMAPPGLHPWFAEVPCWGPAGKHKLKAPFVPPHLFPHLHSHIYGFAFPPGPLAHVYFSSQLNWCEGGSKQLCSLPASRFPV